MGTSRNLGRNRNGYSRNGIDSHSNLLLNTISVVMSCGLVRVSLGVYR